MYLGRRQGNKLEPFIEIGRELEGGEEGDESRHRDAAQQPLVFRQVLLERPALVIDRERGHLWQRDQFRIDRLVGTRVNYEPAWRWR